MDKASFYHFIADEKPLFLALCKDLYGNAEDADVVSINYYFFVEWLTAYNREISF